MVPRRVSLASFIPEQLFWKSESITLHHAFFKLWGKFLEVDLFAGTGALVAVCASTPWFAGKRLARWFLLGTWVWLTLKPGTRPRRTARWMVMKLADFLSVRPRLKAAAVRLLAPFPAFAQQLRAVIHRKQVREKFYAEGLASSETNATDLSLRARDIYTELKAAIARHEGGR